MEGERATSQPTVTEPAARAALRFVGKDRVAEAIWLRAINDPAQPAGTRKDLIEDLADEGYSDPNNMAERDLPLISARMELIERLAPFALDEVNRLAFQEAYKDLLSVQMRLLGARGK